MQNRLAVLTWMDEAEEWISDIEQIVMENNETDKKRDRNILDHKCWCRELNDSIKHNNICIIGVSAEEGREKEAEDLFEQNIDKNFPNLGKETENKIEDAQSIPIKINKKLAKTKTFGSKIYKIYRKEKNPKSSKGKKSSKITKEENSGS